MSLESKICIKCDNDFLGTSHPDPKTTNDYVQYNICSDCIGDGLEITIDEISDLYDKLQDRNK